MPVTNNHESVIRQYLLGQLTDDEQENVEQRLVLEDEFFEELEIVKDELVVEYAAGRLQNSEKQRFEENFLASPEGKRRLGFTKALNRYVVNHPQLQKKVSWGERWASIFKQRAVPVQAFALAMVVIVVGIFWFARAPSPSFATLTLSNSQTTRSTGVELARIRVKEDALRINLMLERPAPSGVRYRAELIYGSGQIRTLEPIGQDANSVSVEIPSAWLTSGQYAISLSKISSDNTDESRLGNYQFIIE